MEATHTWTANGPGLQALDLSTSHPELSELGDIVNGSYTSLEDAKRQIPKLKRILANLYDIEDQSKIWVHVTTRVMLICLIFQSLDRYFV